MISSIGSSSSSWFSMPDWSSGTDNSLGSFYADSNSSLADAFSTAAGNQLDGTVNLVSDAAAKRLGITLPSSSTSTTSSTASSPSSTPPSTSSPPPPSGGPSSAYTNIDQFLASLDGNPAVPAASTSSASGNFDINSYLSSLDQITATNPFTAKVPQNPTGANFSVDSYLATLDSIIPPPPQLVNVTA